MQLVEKGAKVNLAGDTYGITPLWAAVNTRVAAAHTLPAAAGDGLSEGHLPRRHEGAARSRRGS
jgi:hypothetical protein